MNKIIRYLVVLLLCVIFIFGCGKEQTTAGIEILDDEFREIVIEEGIVCKDDIIYEYDGQAVYATGDAALDAEAVGEMILNSLEGQETEAYRNFFDDDKFYRAFQQQDREQLEAGWKANPYYDCYYICAAEEEGYAGYTYYIYPDFGYMNAETAKAVVFGCVVNATNRKLCDTKLEIYDMSLAEYRALRDWKGDRVTFIKNGEVVEGWSQFGDLLRKDLQTGNLESGEISSFFVDQSDMGLAEFGDEVRACINDGWSLRDEYDFYYMCQNEREGAAHYRSYFYWSSPETENEKVLVTDTWISETEIREIQNRWFLTRRHHPEETLTEGENRKALNELSDVEAFLEFDWTDSEVLMSGHAIQPQDSAQGWEFSIADVDFDGIQEMLITFTANHCGTNSLYIYRQENGKVFSCADTIATPESYMLSGIDYKKISPYMDIELMDAYVNSKREYRYISLDCSSFGGDIHGGIYTVSLYESVLTADGVPKELARIEFCGPEQRKELFFQGEKVYEAGRLRDLIADYMDGYIPVEITYNTVEKSFARDIVGQSDTEKEKENQELQEAILKLVTEGAVPIHEQTESLADCGAVSGENRQYFTEYAMRQLEETDWEMLNSQWKVERIRRRSLLFRETNF